MTVPTQSAMRFPDTVQSVVHSSKNGPLLAAAATLWIEDGDKVLDMTYGRGRFWTEYRPENLVTNDIDPATGADHNANFVCLPFDDESFDVAVFDPPYIAQGGRDTSITDVFLKRYGLVDVPKTAAGVRELIADGMAEGARVLRPGGRLFVKGIDYVTGGKFQQGHFHVVSTAMSLGLEQVDEFIHYSGTGPGSWDRQVHSRRAHSFLCVFAVRGGVS